MSGTGSGDGGGVAEGGGVYSEDGALVLDGVSVTGNAVSPTAPEEAGTAESSKVEGSGSSKGARSTIRNSDISGNVANATAGREAATAGWPKAVATVLEFEAGTTGWSLGEHVQRQLRGCLGRRRPTATEASPKAAASWSRPKLRRCPSATSQSPAIPPAQTGGGSGNGGVVEGGGLLVELDGGKSLSLVSSTIANNSIDAGPNGVAEGGNVEGDPGVKVANTIVSGGSGPAGAANCGENLAS